MSDSYIFNSPSIKTEEVNTKTLNIWPGGEQEDLRVNILDLLHSLEKNLQYPFKLANDNELTPASAATGWFNASSLTDGIVKINGISFNINEVEGEHIGEKFVNLLNTSDGSPVDANYETITETAHGWFIPGFLTDSIIIINGTEYVADNAESFEQGFVNVINADENCPVVAKVAGGKVYLDAKETGKIGNSITIARKSPTNPADTPWANNGTVGDSTTLEGGIGPIYIVHLTALNKGEVGNSITLSHEADPVVEYTPEWASGETLTGGSDEYYSVSIGEGNVYLPAKTICAISEKSNLLIPTENYSGYVVLELMRDGEGNISYRYNIAHNLEEDGFKIIYPTEI